MADEMLVLLRSIDTTLKELVSIARAKRAAAPAEKRVATDRELDGPYGDPVLRFKPRDWTGPSYKGQPFSQCPAELLDIIADTSEWFATQAEAKNERTAAGKPIADYRRADAAKARGWAKRRRAGTHAPVTAGIPGEAWAGPSAASEASDANWASEIEPEPEPEPEADGF